VPEGDELMAEEIFIPKAGQTVEEVTLVRWLVEDGAQVAEGQELLEIETDKTNFMVESTAKGTVRIGPFQPGQVIPVLTVVAIVGRPDEKFPGAAAPAAAPAEAAPEAQAAPAAGQEIAGAGPAAPAQSAAEHQGRLFVSPRARKLAEAKGVDLRRVVPSGAEGQRVVEKDVVAYLAQMPKVTPLAQKMAAEAGIDVRDVKGTGDGGRVTREDVERAIAPAAAAVAAPPAPAPSAPAPSSAPVAAAAPPAAPAAPTPVPAFTASGETIPDVLKRVPLTGVRKIIAERMGKSVHTTARVTLIMEMDATEFVGMRERLKAKVSEAWGFTPGYNDLLAKIVAQALRQHPYMNARLTEDAIEHAGHINMGMAVDTERGLLVPVIRDADLKSLRQFGAEFRQMVERARVGRSLPDDLAGGTFTITNLGMYDVDAFTPVINLPEAAILGVGRIAPKWVYRADSPNAPVLRQMWTLSLVFDHRMIDGAPAARFLQYIKNVVEEPYLLLAA
jgi:pyruvate dehydrogenase E2 component (dihydrolipoamide acetyltransferase)